MSEPDVATARVAGDLPGATPVITGRGWSVPDDVLTNADVAARIDETRLRSWVGENRWCQERLEGKSEVTRADLEAVYERYVEERIGIRQRHVVDRSAIVEGRRSTNGVYASHLGASALAQALEDARIPASDLEAIVCPTSSPDRIFPSTAVEIQAQVSATGAHAFDVAAACTGLGYGLHVARALVASGMHRRVAVVCAEYFTAMVNYTEPANAFFWGDGAGAVVVERADLVQGRPGDCLVDSHCISSPSQCIRTGLGGTRPFLAGAGPNSPLDDIAPGSPEDPYFYQDGRQVYRDVVPTVVKETGHLISRNDLSVDQVSRFWFHQPSLLMINAIAKRLLKTDHEDERIPLVLEKYGNTSSAGAALAFAQGDPLEPGQWGCVSVFGAGYTVGCALLRRLEG